MRKPIIARSSSPLEDGVRASFAGMFSSFQNNQTYDEFCASANSVYESGNQERVRNYAQRMGIDFTEAMALIAQEK